ncbi:MAG TPA: aminotransferase class I/II-fold pyridoxal phosphate-dependent enzyme [Chloroflexi bacterium]|nr:aminotransferase class I/II-fold pyridoxal phosphate-dependent enzyme [Chloroflexota bacterium]
MTTQPVVKRLALASRLENIPPYPFVARAERIRELKAGGHDVIRLDIGNPDLPPHPAVIEALYNSAQNPANHGYGGYAGKPALRRAFADYYARRFGVSLDPEREVLPLIGSKEGLINIGLALLNPGDVVLVPDPAYLTYSRGALLAEAEPYRVPLVPERNFMPDLESIPPEVLARARLLWINYPNNPTGAVASKDELAGIVDFCREHDILLCSDNPYADVTFDGVRAHSVLEVPGAKEIAVEFNSLSKTYNMAGWRVGVCVGNAEMVNALLRIKSNVDSGLFLAIQDAACVALNEVGKDWIAGRNAIYQRRRDILMEALPRLGLSATPPQAALYVWARVDGGDDVAYSEEALEEAHVSVTPGRIYGPAGRGYVRLSLVIGETRMREAIRRLSEWYTQRGG